VPVISTTGLIVQMCDEEKKVLVTFVAAIRLSLSSVCRSMIKKLKLSKAFDNYATDNLTHVKAK